MAATSSKQPLDTAWSRLPVLLSVCRYRRAPSPDGDPECAAEGAEASALIPNLSLPSPSPTTPSTAARTVSSPTPEPRRKKAKATVDELASYDESGPVFDTCNEVRRKIRAHLRKSGTSIAAFLRELGGINSNSYRQFMSMKDPLQGSGNCIYPAAYHYFEKRRLAEGKAKSQLRLESEAAFPHGYSLAPNWGRCLVPQGTVPVVDRIGRITIVPHYPRPRPLSMKRLEEMMAEAKGDDQ